MLFQIQLFNANISIGFCQTNSPLSLLMMPSPLGIACADIWE
jgi:hypothetical protein